MKMFILDKILISNKINRRYRKKVISYKDIDHQLNQLTSSIYDEYNLKHVPIVFSWLIDSGSNFPTAFLLRNNQICLNSEWAFLLISEKTNLVKRSFLASIGHELTHTKVDYVCRKSCITCRKFVNWVNEIHADFGAAEYALSSKRYLLLESFNFKRVLKLKACKKDRASFSHPSWEYRILCISQYNFDHFLIRKIANDCKCCDNNLIEDITNYYSEIKLI